MFGGSPHIVADPPKLAQKTSAMIMGTGLNFNSSDSSIVTAARNKITVILSMNIAKKNDNSINVIKMDITLYLTSFAISIHNQRKNPTRAIPSTITIIPNRKMMVAQLTPLLDSPPPYQNPNVPIVLKFKVSTTACIECNPSPNTKTNVKRPQPRVMYCFSTTSVTIRINIATKITTANTCANIFVPLFFLFYIIFLYSQVFILHHFTGNNKKRIC